MTPLPILYLLLGFIVCGIFDLLILPRIPCVREYYKIQDTYRVGKKDQAFADYYAGFPLPGLKAEQVLSIVNRTYLLIVAIPLCNFVYQIIQHWDEL